MSSILLAALDYCSKGFSVIPLKPKDKIPIISSWGQYQNEPATEEQIKTWWALWPLANIGLVTGTVSHHVVVDLDSLQAKSEFKKLCTEVETADCPIAVTGKGWHVYFKHPGGKLPNRAAIKPGIDFRGDGGYVVAPPSVHPSGALYTWLRGLNGRAPDLPTKFVQACAVVPQNDFKPRFDTARAIAGLPHGERDIGMFKLACKLRGADVPYEVAFALCEEAGRNCQPPFTETKRKVDQAYKYPTGGGAQKQPEFWPELLSAKEALNLPPDPTRWLWEDCLPVHNLSLLVAKPKVGKSTFAAALSICIARGYPFLGRAIQQAPVAYLSLDAPLADILETLKAFGLKDSDPLFLHAGRAPGEALKWLLEQVQKHDIRFVVIDTMQRLFRFRDLNDYASISNELEPVLDANAHIMLLHHAGKGQGDDLDSAIGSTALRGLAYSFLHLKRLPNSTHRIFRSDQRGGKNFDEIAISDGAEGFIEKAGTREDAEIADCKPLIREFLIEEANPEGITEKEIQLAIPLRRRVLVRAVRRMLASHDLERTGAGKRGNAYRYYLPELLVPGNKEEKELRELELISRKYGA